MRNNLSYYRRRAERIGSLERKIVCDGGIDGAFEELQRLHQARCAAKQRSGAFSDETALAHQRESAQEFAEAGLLRLMLLECGGRKIAAAEAFRDRRSHGNFYVYLTGFDPKFADCSPGTLLIEEMVKQAILERCATVDFLRGGEQYKELWGAATVSTFCRRIWG